ncbi:hypothetical protein SC171_08610 [Pantoea cypripedii]|uniref:hypothetical protein n=1 Tax=Pantoea cypripedii TaxID=55209 RepID=UPI002FC58576
MTIKSNFFLQTNKSHNLDEINTNDFHDPEQKRLFDAFKNNMNEVVYVVQSYFNLMVHAKIQEASGKIFDRNRMLAYADSLRGFYSDDRERINKDASERTRVEIENGELEKYSILELVINTLNALEKDLVIETSNKSTLRQSIVIVWSAIESLIRDIIRIILNSDTELASHFFESSEKNTYWQKKQISFEHLKKYNFDLTNRLGDIALDMNSCSNLSAMRTAISNIFGNNSLSYRSLKSLEFYKLYKLRNVISHRNGVVDEKYKSEVSCPEKVGEIVNVTPEVFNSCFLAAKDLALCLIKEMPKEIRYSNADNSISSAE